MGAKLTLGGIEFYELEMPADIAAKVRQSVVVKKHIGGSRTLNPMGGDYEPISWSGYFLGDTGDQRSRYLRQMCLNGLAVDLAWNNESFRVVVSEYDATYKLGLIEYRITCLVDTDKMKPINKTAKKLNDAVREDMTTITSLADEIGNDTLSSMVDSLSTAIKSVSDFAKATKSQINGVLQIAANVRAQAQILVSQASAAAFNVVSLGGALPNTKLSDVVMSLTNKAVALNNLPPLQSLNSTLDRMTKNISSVYSGAQTVSVSGKNAETLASQHYGRAAETTSILQANNLTDPALFGISSVLIPQSDTGTGGIP